MISKGLRLISLLTFAALLVGCGSGAGNYSPAGQSSGQAPAATTAAGGTTAGKVHLVYFNARGA